MKTVNLSDVSTEGFELNKREDFATVRAGNLSFSLYDAFGIGSYHFDIIKWDPKSKTLYCAEQFRKFADKQGWTEDEGFGKCRDNIDDYIELIKFSLKNKEVRGFIGEENIPTLLDYLK